MLKDFSNLVDKFLYEISSYMAAGTILISFLWYNITPNNNLPSSNLQWVFLLLASYVAGMLIAQFGFRLFSVQNPILGYFSNIWGFCFHIANPPCSTKNKFKLNSATENPNTRTWLAWFFARKEFFTNNNIYDDIVKNVSILVGTDKENLKQNPHIHADTASTLMHFDIRERSSIPEIYGGHYNRMCLAKNLTIVLILITGLLFIPGWKIPLFENYHKVYCQIGLLAIAFLLLMYVPVQSLWRGGFLMKQWYFLTRLNSRDLGPVPG